MPRFCCLHVPNRGGVGLASLGRGRLRITWAKCSPLWSWAYSQKDRVPVAHLSKVCDSFSVCSLECEVVPESSREKKRQLKIPSLFWDKAFEMMPTFSTVLMFMNFWKTSSHIGFKSACSQTHSLFISLSSNFLKRSLRYPCSLKSSAFLFFQL